MKRALPHGCSWGGKPDSHEKDEIWEIYQLHNPRRGENLPKDPDRARRYKARTQVERIFARLKDEFGGRKIFVRGDRKVMAT